MDDSTNNEPNLNELENMDNNEEVEETPDVELEEEGTAENANIDEEPDIEGEISSSVQIAPTANTSLIVAEDNNDPYLFIELGDRVVIDSTKYGRTTGYVYYRDGDLISILPDGVSNILHNFNIEQTEDSEVFDSELGVTASYIIDKRKFDSFVEQQDFRVGQTIETIGSNGELDKSFKIINVDQENDTITIEDESGSTENVDFGFIGIPRDESFVIIRTRQTPTPIGNTNNEMINETQNELEKSLEIEGEIRQEGEEDEIETPKKKVQIVGYVTLAKTNVYKEAPPSQQRFPDTLQKTDALNDFLNMLDPLLQKDQKAVRAVRILVETLFYLKQSTIAYNEDGSIRGQQQISANTIADLIQKTNIPLGRPILDVAKKLYSNPEELEENEEVNNQSDEYFFENFNNELAQIVQNTSPIVSSSMIGASGGQIVRHWNDTASFLKKYLSTWAPNSNAEPLWKAIEDSDFFRSEAPDLESSNVPGYLPTLEEDVFPPFSEIPYGLERALGTTYRKGFDRKKQVLVPEESATMKSYLIFPQKTVAHLGTTRSGSLVIDSGRSQLPPKTMTQILKEIGEPQEVGTSQDLLLLNVDGNTLGNIPLKDYIEGLSIPGLGIGDTFSTLQQFGIDNLELTPELVEVLQTKIESYQSQLLHSLLELREILQKESEVEPELNPLLDETALENLESGIRSEPILVEDINIFEKLNPTLSKSDIALIAYILKKHSDYFQVAAGNNPVYTAKERMRATRSMFLESLHIASLLKENKANVGLAPIPNNCEHVSKLTTIRKIQDDTERFQLLTKFFAKYQGDRDNNWINCNICDKHLMCLHERLQIQSFLNPIEKDTIHKEIILNFAGGQFQGSYICRNCGQSIKDIDFDTHLEYDDEGKPMIGRAILVDKDALEQEKLQNALGVPIRGNEENDETIDNIGKSKKIIFSKDELPLKDIIKEISVRVGIALPDDGYRRVIDRVVKWINNLTDKTKYAEFKKKNPALMEYDMFLAIQTVCSCAAFLLIEIQMHIPSYIVRYTLQLCKNPGFDGWPMDNNSKQGLEYMSCAVASIVRNQPPWNQTGFQMQRSDIKRIQMVQVFIEKIATAEIKDDLIQQGFLDKRKYLEEILGADSGKGIPKDIIPATFLPEQIIITPVQAAENAIIPEVAQYMGNKGKISLVKQWIQQSHVLAKKTASLIRGSPLSETTCCLSNISEPNTFWKSASDLPELDKRELVPNKQGVFFQVHYKPRPIQDLLVQPDQEFYYRVFLKCCFQGPRIGFPHEPGLTNKCAWCGFQFPTNPNVLDTDTEGKSALSSQNVDTSEPEFTKLLDTIHTVNKVEPVKQKQIESMESVMNNFGELNPEPISGWKEIISDTTQSFLKLPKDANRGDLAQALGSLSDATSDAERIIDNKLSENSRNILNMITSLSWLNWYQVIQSYFITPFKRILTQFNTSSLIIPYELKLSEDHKGDIQKIINMDINIVNARYQEFKKPQAAFARAKMAYFLSQMSAILTFKNKLRATLLPGRDKTLQYIQRSLLYGPLAILLDPSSIPPETEYVTPVRSIGDPSMKLLTEIVILSLDKFNKERLSYNDQELRELVAIKNEKEKMNIIKEFDRMTEEERAVELTKKKLGLGRWSIGGTKLIYAYDPDQYDRERIEREKAGIIDFPGLGPDEIPELNGAEYDDFGFPMSGEGDYEREEGGYDVTQTAEDDA
jgi:hypothetical protein